MIDPLAKGIKTSEFWLSFLSMGLTFAAVKGLIDASQINPILNAVSQIYGGAIGLITIYAILRSYIQSRTAIKTTLINQGKLPIATPNQNGV